jgi:hypothetical protein
VVRIQLVDKVAGEVYTYACIIAIEEGVRNAMKEYICVQTNHHKKIAEVIQKHAIEGWRLHTYQATGQATMTAHYLLFERG